MRCRTPLTVLLLAAASAVAAPPDRPPQRGPRIDLVAAPPQVPVPVFVPFPRFYGPFWGGGFYPEFYLPPPVVIVPQPVPVPVPAPNPVRAVEDADRAAARVAAVLTLELPAAADVWLDGQKQASSADTTCTLTSPPLTLGESYTFRVRARWVDGGTTYEAEQTSTVRAGERGKLTVYAGTVVK